ncbi:citrate lyase beta subunit (plasmid) [Cupriavidus necator N-1]|uniref:Citrate lyase beta subunit n=1 Tax=Cupriavidus necator (strain ATCC 43291 / DSM 13513 / CCUG 52238 / LMG 8453 / N-1) TaxID=1042878 RepID=F8GVT0_CUPNN|nr:citrate lyase beta subunit [Cupriavidus necator N-1]
MIMRPTPSRRPVTLRRSWLFTSGMDERAQAAALASGADVLVPDLEEFTAPADRLVARPRVAALMSRCRALGIVAAVRINRLTGDGWDDLRGVMPGSPDAVFLPYVESADEIATLDRAISALEAELGLPKGTTEIVPTIESALGFIHIQHILAASERVRACLLAAEDLTADLGAERGPDSLELNHLRSRFHVECRAAGRVAIDCPYNYRDMQAQAEDLAWARRIGLKAKCAVYPEQVAQIHAAFTPSIAQVELAKELVARFEAARRGEPIGDALVESPDYHTARRLLTRDAEFKTWTA